MRWQTECMNQLQALYKLAQEPVVVTVRYPASLMQCDEPNDSGDGIQAYSMATCDVEKPEQQQDGPVQYPR